MKKKICLIAHLNDLSGANKALVDLAEGLSVTNEVTVIVPRKGRLKTMLDKMNIKSKVIHSATWVYKKDETIIKRIIKQIINLVAEQSYYLFFKSERFDIVHFNSITYGCGASSAKKLGIPFTWHIRELAEENFNLTFFDKQSALQCVNSAKRIITISQFMKKAIADYIDVSKVEVVYDGIKVLWDGCDNDNDARGYPVPHKIALIGAIARDKGQIDAINALKYLTQVGHFYKLYFVGQVTDEAYYEELKSTIDESIESQIEFCGYTPDVSKYRTNEYLALVCSPAEAFGLVTVEAMYAGQLVIGADGGATSEIIQNLKNGFLYKSGDYKDLANKVLTIEKDIDIYKIAYEAKIRVINNFNVEETVRKVDEILEDCIRKGVNYYG